MSAPTGRVIHDALARGRLLARAEALRQSGDLLSGRVDRVRFPGIVVACLPVPDKSPTHARGRRRWEADCSGPALRNDACACRAEMAAVVVGIQSEALALARRPTQVRAHGEALDRARGVDQVCAGAQVTCMASHYACGRAGHWGLRHRCGGWSLGGC